MAPGTPYQELWFSTSELVSRFKPSLSNVFAVYIKDTYGPISNGDINFLAYDAVLPGISYELGQVYGDRQGRIEQYPTRKVYPPVDVSFYIDQDYKVLQFFESWMAAISPNIGAVNNSFVKYNYPQDAKYETEIIITKFERLFRQPNQRLVEAGVYSPPLTYVEYTLRNAYPINLIAVPVSYDGANVLRTTVTFNYDVYNFKRKNGSGTDENGTGTVSGPGGDSASQGSQGSAASQKNILGNSQAELDALQRQAYTTSTKGRTFKSAAAQEIANQEIYSVLNQ